jgi:hypothetical protein
MVERCSRAHRNGRSRSQGSRTNRTKEGACKEGSTKEGEEMSGERKGAREAMDKMVRQMVNSGTSVEYAKKKAVKAAQSHDKKNKR